MTDYKPSNLVMRIRARCYTMRKSVPVHVGSLPIRNEPEVSHFLRQRTVELLQRCLSVIGARPARRRRKSRGNEQACCILTLVLEFWSLGRSEHATTLRLESRSMRERGSSFYTAEVLDSIYARKRLGVGKRHTVAA